MATEPYRDRVARLPLIDPHLTRAGYRRTLERYFGFYTPLEAAWESYCIPALRRDMARRRKTHRLIQDLFALGATPQQVATLPLCRILPRMDAYPRLLGVLYAVESANLDGPIMSLHVRHALGRDVERACQFFDGCGAHVELMWDCLVENVQLAAAQPDQQEIIIESACSTFQCFEGWMAAE